MTKINKEKEIDLIRDPDVPFADAQRVFSGRLKEKGLTQKHRMSYTLQLAVAARALGNLLLSVKLLADCEKYIISYGSPEEKSTFFFLRAMHLSNQAKYEEAMTLALRCLQLAQGADFPIVTLRALACCGRVCYRLLMYSEAMDYMTRGLELARQINNSKQILLFMYQVVDIKKQLLDAKEALKEIEALEQYRRQDMKAETDISDALIFESLARTAIETGDLKKAKQYMSLAIEVRKSLNGDTTMLSDHYSVAGKICTAENDEKGMLAYTQKCVELAKENRQPLGEFYAHVERFYHYMTYNMITKAKKQLDAVKVSATQIRSVLTDYELDLASMKYCQHTGDSARELQCLKRIYEYRMSSQQQVVAHRLRHIAAIHQLEIKEREGEFMKKELNLKSQELNLTNHHLQQRNDLLTEPLPERRERVSHIAELALVEVQCLVEILEHAEVSPALPGQHLIELDSFAKLSTVF